MEPGILYAPTDDWYSDYERARANKQLRSFTKWAKANPDVTRWLFREVSWMVDRHRRSSMKALFEEMRYSTGIRITSVDGEIKLDNSYSPLIVRIMKKSIPGAENVFTCRPSYVDLLEDDQLPTYDYVGTLHFGGDSDER